MRAEVDSPSIVRDVCCGVGVDCHYVGAGIDQKRLLIFSVVMAAGLNYLRVQSESYRLGSRRMDMLQNLWFAANVLSLDLRTAGSNTPDEQPFLVYAGSDVVAINADYTTNVANDAWAVYYDPDAPTGSVTALVPGQSITIPHTAFTYPSVAYTALGRNRQLSSGNHYFLLRSGFVHNPERRLRAVQAGQL